MAVKIQTKINKPSALKHSPDIRLYVDYCISLGMKVLASQVAAEVRLDEQSCRVLQFEEAPFLEVLLSQVATHMTLD